MEKPRRGENSPIHFEHLENKVERSLAWDMLNLSTELAEVLKAEEERSSLNEFCFYEDRLEGVVLPHYVASACLTNRLDEVQIDITTQIDSPSSRMILRFVVLDEDNQKIIIQLESPLGTESNYSCYTNRVRGDLGEEVHQVSAGEVNRCIASLIYPSADDPQELEKFSAIDMRSHFLTGSLLSSLEAHASYRNSEKEYRVSSQDRKTEGIIRHYFDESGELYLSEVSRTIREEYAVSHDGSLIEDVRRITARIELGDAKEIGGIEFFIEEGHKPSVEIDTTSDDFFLTLTFMQEIVSKYARDDIPFSEMDPNSIAPQREIDDPQN